MAYNKCDSDKHASYMDGIPVKISEKYKPPKKIILPGSVVNKLSSEISLPEYDFTLEKSVLEKMTQWRQLRQSQRDARKQRITAEQQARAANKTEEAPSTEPTTPATILTPVPIHASTHPTTNLHSSFNISEFEQDTSSPFDNMELKTINDLEELAHVLQPVVIAEKPVDSDKKTPPPPRLNGFNQYSYDSWTHYNAPPGCYPPGNSVQSYVVQRMDSRSVPDILQELRTELRDKREAEQRTEPPRPSSTGPAEMSSRKTAAEVNASWVSAEQPSTLPNPYAQLPSTCQRLCDRLAEMGFPLARVARATKLFGDDETRVVEFLVQVQRLEELKFSGDRAEQALVANEYKDTETLEYLRTQSQLLDLGFSEDQVMKAIKECGTDRDKALDWLIS
ncbi:ubiquitin-associated protein 1-like [Macrosteles quadrilineatus]|uniref:ubiquitin-associated protein 1-like n=1 Tax=Macrosteles quadrilineatus TaxID=74068 RepID=UPI0023E1DCF5|nr:ubiquitin-associated protein 1-like [Macrosteles quadrilineatus]